MHNSSITGFSVHKSLCKGERGWDGRVGVGGRGGLKSLLYSIHLKSICNHIEATIRMRLLQNLISDPTATSHIVKWEDTTIAFDGVPYFVLAQKLYDCRNGIDRKKRWKEKRKEIRQVFKCE